MSNDSQPTVQSATPSLPMSQPNTARYAVYLKALYTSRMSPPAQRGLALSSHKCVNLTVVRKGQFSMTEVVELAGKRAAGIFDLNKNQIVSVEDLLLGGSNSNCILLEGSLGVGKTTLAWELCRRWEELEPLKKFSLVVFIQLSSSVVQEAGCLADLIYHRNSDLRQGVVKEIEAVEGEGLLLVIDEFCQLPRREESVLDRLLVGSYLPKAKLVVFSRPCYTPGLLAKRAVDHDSQFEILGFSEESIKLYAEMVMKDKPSLQSFHAYVVGNPTLHGLLSVPLLCAVVVDVLLSFPVDQENIIMKPLTEIMSSIFKALVLRHLLKEDKVPSNYKMPATLEELPGFSKIIEISKLAFEGVLQKKYNFDSPPLGYSCLGLLTQMLFTDEEIQVVSCFLHRTLQEYLAAVYMNNLSLDDQQQLFRAHSEAPNFENVWLFASGMGFFKNIGWELVKLHYAELPYTDPDTEFDDDGDVADDESQSESIVYYTNRFIFHTLFESQDQSACDTVFQESLIVYQPHKQPSPFDMFTVGYCVAHSTRIWFLDLRLTTVGQRAVELLRASLNFQPAVTGTISSIMVGGNSAFHGPGLYEIMKMPKAILDGINSLALYDEFEVDAEALSAALVLLPNLKGLEVHGCIGGEKTSAVLQQLAQLKLLEDLFLNCSQFNPVDLDALSKLVESSSSLSTLEVRGEDMSPACTKLLLSSTISQSASLNTVRLSKVNFEYCADIFLHLLSSTNLSSVVIVECVLETQAAVCIAQALTSNTSLQSLQIIGSFVADEGAIALSKMLTANRTLKSLVLTDHSLGPSGVCAIAEALEHNTEIHQIALPKAYKSFVPDELVDKITAEIMWFP